MPSQQPAAPDEKSWEIENDLRTIRDAAALVANRLRLKRALDLQREQERGLTALMKAMGASDAGA